MNIIDQMSEQSTLTPAQQAVLTDWERAEQSLGWTGEERVENARFLQNYPELSIVAIDLAKFGSVNGLILRYEGLLRRCREEGLLTPCQEAESAQMARSGAISIASVIGEGKELKKWLDEETERRKMTQEFSAAWPEKTVLAA